MAIGTVRAGSYDGAQRNATERTRCQDAARSRTRMDFEVNIEMGKPNVVGVNREHSGLLDVEVPLAPSPDRHWTQIFNDGPPGVPYSPAREAPRLSGSVVYMRPSDDDLERSVEYLKIRVAGTNAYYNREVAPRLKQAHEAQEAEEAERARRVEEARRRLDSET